MPPMPYYYVGKGMQLRVTDDFYAGDKTQYMAANDAALKMMEGPDAVTFEQMARDNQASGNLAGGDVTHFAAHWLDGGWWPQHPVRELLHYGFLEAVKIAKDAQLPVEALWVCAEKSEHDPFHVYICRGPRQVTVVIYTPPPGEWTRDDLLTTPEDIWVVKVHDEYDDRMPGSVDSLDQVGDKQIIKRQLMCTPPPSRP